MAVDGAGGCALADARLGEPLLISRCRAGRAPRAPDREHDPFSLLVGLAPADGDLEALGQHGNVGDVERDQFAPSKSGSRPDQQKGTIAVIGETVAELLRHLAQAGDGEGLGSLRGGATGAAISPHHVGDHRMPRVERVPRHPMRHRDAAEPPGQGGDGNRDSHQYA
ncbi:hypothetical protein [Methylobacterium tarhaniae]|uniref:hypothetical protein n=1 Tax=Methylobacterium tarhaniae TaxID=1187852 RepID=UPI003CFDEB72